MSGAQAPHVFLVAGEDSGDRLGAALIAAIRRACPGARFSGVGGAQMAAQGVASLFPLGDLAIIGFAAIPASLPKILARIRQTAAAVVAAKPDVLVIIDSPEFTHRVARRVRARDAGDPDRRLCVSVGVGLAARPRARHARLCRSCAGAAAVRAGGAAAAGRAGLDLRRPSAERAHNVAAAERTGGGAAARRSAAAPGAAGQPRQRNPPHGGRVRRGRRI